MDSSPDLVPDRNQLDAALVALHDLRESMHRLAISDVSVWKSLDDIEQTLRTAEASAPLESAVTIEGALVANTAGARTLQQAEGNGRSVIWHYRWTRSKSAFACTGCARMYAYSTTCLVAFAGDRARILCPDCFLRQDGIARISAPGGTGTRSFFCVRCEAMLAPPEKYGKPPEDATEHLCPVDYVESLVDPQVPWPDAPTWMSWVAQQVTDAAPRVE